MTDSLKAKMLLGVGVGIGVTALSGLYYRYYKSQMLLVPPTKWKKVGTLEEIYYYPIKSCAGIKLDSGMCENLGIRDKHVKDRSLMLVDRTGLMVSARTYPKMMKIQPELLKSGKLLITAPQMNPLELDYRKIGEEGMRDIRATIWGADVYVSECGREFDQWFSQYLLGKDEGLRLVYYPYPIPTRPIVEKRFNNGVFLSSDTGTLQDVSSYLLINEDSVRDLNTRLKNKVHHLQFRGNFLIKTFGGAPYDEDNWKWIRIGDEVIFRSLAPCYRCIVPNVNPFTGERDPDMEPLKTLKTYRCLRNCKDPVMGVQMGLRNPGTINRGDDVFVEDLSPEIK